MKAALRTPTRAAFLAALFLLVTGPAIWLVTSSFKNRVDIQKMPPVFRFEPTTSHYSEAFVDRGFDESLFNSVVVAVLSSVLAVGLAYPAAVVLHRVPRIVANHLLFFVLSTRLIPPVALGLPLHLLYRDLGLLDTLAGLILAHGAFNLSFAVWMVAAFLRRMPSEIFDAAALDGLGSWRLSVALLPKLFLPVLMIGVFCFVFSWNEFFLATVLTGGDAGTLPVSILGLVSSQGTHWGMFCAVGTVTLAPVVVFVFVLRRFAGALLSLGGVPVESKRGES